MDKSTSRTSWMLSIPGSHYVNLRPLVLMFLLNSVVALLNSVKLGIDANTIAERSTITNRTEGNVIMRIAHLEITEYCQRIVPVHKYTKDIVSSVLPNQSLSMKSRPQREMLHCADRGPIVSNLSSNGTCLTCFHVSHLLMPISALRPERSFFG